MDKRRRLNIIKSLAARELSSCSRCQRDVNLDETENIVITKIDKAGTHRLSNVLLRHKACLTITNEQVLSIFARGPAEQRCCVCWEDLTILNPLDWTSKLGISRDYNGVPHLVHISCVWRLNK